MTSNPLSYIVVLKKDCPTCALVEQVVAQMQTSGCNLEIWSQDDPSFPASATNVSDDRNLEQSWRLKIETVPTLIRLENNTESERTVGWDRQEWQRLVVSDQLGLE